MASCGSKLKRVRNKDWMHCTKDSAWSMGPTKSGHAFNLDQKISNQRLPRQQNNSLCTFVLKRLALLGLCLALLPVFFLLAPLIFSLLCPSPIFFACPLFPVFLSSHIPSAPPPKWVFSKSIWRIPRIKYFLWLFPNINLLFSILLFHSVWSQAGFIFAALGKVPKIVSLGLGSCMPKMG